RAQRRSRLRLRLRAHARACAVRRRRARRAGHRECRRDQRARVRRPHRDLMPRLDELLASGVPLTNMDDGRALATVRDRVVAANAYLGAWPIAEALADGAQIVVTGRVTDAALTLGPLVHEHG